MTEPIITYILIWFQNITRAKLRDVFRNETDVSRKFSVLFTSNSNRSPRAVTFSIKTKTKNHNAKLFFRTVIKCMVMDARQGSR